MDKTSKQRGCLRLSLTNNFVFCIHDRLPGCPFFCPCPAAPFSSPPSFPTLSLQERFITKETRRFLKLADFKKEGFFDFKEFVADYCQEANYDFGVAEKKKKLKLKET